MNELEEFEESLRALKPRRPDPGAAERIEEYLRQERPVRQGHRAPLAGSAAALSRCVTISPGIWRVTHIPPRQPPLRTGPVVVTIPVVPLEPTLRVYRMALSRSPEALDALLLEQAKTILVRTHESDILSHN